MKVKSGAQMPRPELETVDITRGAVTFDPWPFHDDSVRMADGCRYLGYADEPLTQTGPYALVESDNTLAYTTHGNLVVMDEATWNALVEHERSEQ